MKIYVTRHGQTDMNLTNKVCGRTDVALNEEGCRQAIMLKEQLIGKEPDIILSSPMLRTMQTSQIVSGGRIPIFTDMRLIEQHYGIYEGVDRYDEGFLNNKRMFAYKYPGGESMMDVAHRAYDILDEIQAMYSDNTVLLVTHGGVCRLINSYFEDMTNEQFFNFSMGNAQLLEYEVNLSIKKFNEERWRY